MVPDPHVAEHDPHVPQLFQVQSTANQLHALHFKDLVEEFFCHLDKDLYCMKMNWLMILYKVFPHKVVHLYFLTES